VNLAWASAHLLCEVEPLRHAIASASLRMLDEFSPMSLAMTSWSGSRFHFRNEPWLHAIASLSGRLITAFTSQNISNLAWAVSPM